MNPANKPYYTFSWAMSVVLRLHNQHTRATDIVLEIFGISLGELALFLAHRDPMFNYLKGRIHSIDDLASRVGKYYTLVEYRKWIEHLSCNKYSGNLSDRLDSRLKKVRIKEQGSSRGGGNPSGVNASPFFEVTDWGIQYLLEFP